MASSLSIRPPSSIAAKRSHSSDSTRTLRLTPTRSPTPRPELGRNYSVDDDPSVPAFLRQSKADLRKKFEELEWAQTLRIAQGRTDPDPSSPWVQENTREVRLRNRYMNVQAWANSRVHLRVPEGDCDYINASPICLRNSKTGVETRYIATQGPKEIGLSHFWQMIWHETTSIAVIVMLTQTEEAGREKCFQYFPDDIDSDALGIYMTNEPKDEARGSVKLLEKKFDESSRSTIRKLLLRFGDTTKLVWHLLFSGWPDFAVPEDRDRAALLNLIKLSAKKNDAANNPRIIHCSAGVGRSGTFIALEHLLAELEGGTGFNDKHPEDVVYNTVNILREQRMMMVQSEAQFLFIYQVLREEFKRRQATREFPSIADATAPELAHRGTVQPSPKVLRFTKSMKSIKDSLHRDTPPAEPKGEDNSGQGKTPTKL